ncbi:hypothetical protein [Pseudomonas silesiensis]|uniref:hypothetical protein n=1 Tax=Pseudomonas silesiensis TaxID=1853130 RepID=UPI0030D8CF30
MENERPAQCSRFKREHHHRVALEEDVGFFAADDHQVITGTHRSSEDFDLSLVVAAGCNFLALGPFNLFGNFLQYAAPSMNYPPIAFADNLWPSPKDW